MSDPEKAFYIGWCYEPFENSNNCCKLPIADPNLVTPLHITIKNILSGNDIIAIQPSEQGNEANPDHNHFQLEFQPNTLAAVGNIAVDSNEWAIANNSNNELYLLWIGDDSIKLHPNEQLDIILTGVTAAETEGSNPTKVTISWGDIDDLIVSPDRLTPLPTFKYETSETLTLDMIKVTATTPAPLFVGFVGSNQVLNTTLEPNESSSLTLRITNTSFEETIVFSDSPPSKLLLTLEVEDNDVDTFSVPWALGTTDQVDDIVVTLTDWSVTGPIELRVNPGSLVKALQWSLTPHSDVPLGPQESLIIELTGIKTKHPTGETNLYLSYQGVGEYANGQFTCQIEKSPFVTKSEIIEIEEEGGGGGESLDTKSQLRFGTNTYFEDIQDSLIFDRYGGLALGESSEIQNQGPLTFRSNTDSQGGDTVCAAFFHQNGAEPLMHLTSDGKLGIGTTQPQAKLDVNGWGIFSGPVGIGTDDPGAKLHVDGDYYGKGSIRLYAHDGEGQNGTAYIRASDSLGSSNIGLQLGTQNSGNLVDAIYLAPSGNVGIGNQSPSGKLDVDGNIRISGSAPMVIEEYVFSEEGDFIIDGETRGVSVMKFDNRFIITTDYKINEWEALVVGFVYNITADNNLDDVSFAAYPLPWEALEVWGIEVTVRVNNFYTQHLSNVKVLFIKKQLFS